MNGKKDFFRKERIIFEKKQSFMKEKNHMVWGRGVLQYAPTIPNATIQNFVDQSPSVGIARKKE